VINTDNRFVFRVITLLAVVVLALGAAACGDSDDDGNGDSANASKNESDGGSSGKGSPQDVASADDGDPNGTPEEQLTALYGQFVDLYYKKDAKGLCEILSTKAQKQFGKSGGGCEKRFKGMVAETPSPNRPYIVELKVSGNKAVASVKTKNSEAYPVPFVKQGGEWKISGGFGS
jgi:hypothetical protein